MRTLFLCLLLVALVTQPSDALEKQRQLPPEAAEALRTGTTFTLFSLFPPKLYNSYPYPKLKPEESLHGFKILGSTDLTTPKQREAAVSTVNDAIRSSKGIRAACFEPRHALRVHTPEAVFDLVICFECFQIEVFRGDERLSTIAIAGSQKSLDDMLRAAKVPLTRRADPK